MAYEHRGWKTHPPGTARISGGKPDHHPLAHAAGQLVRITAQPARALRRHGFELIAEPESFLVTKQDRLEPQEASRARAWAAGLAERLVAAA